MYRKTEAIDENGNLIVPKTEAVAEETEEVETEAGELELELGELTLVEETEEDAGEEIVGIELV